MASRTITITHDAYDALRAEKKPGESFSELLIRKFRKGGSLMECFGTLEFDAADMRRMSLWRRSSAAYSRKLRKRRG